MSTWISRRSVQSEIAPALVASPLTGRTRLPSGRAVIGGLLIAISTVAMFTVAQSDNGPTTSYLVASKNLPAGRRLTADDLASIDADLAPDAAAAFVTVGRAETVVGHILRRAVDGGRLIESASLADAAEVARANVITVSLDPAFALGGAVTPDDELTVLATYDDCTSVVATGAVVIDRIDQASNLGGDRVTVSLQLDDPNQVLAIAHAQQAGKVTLVRAGVGPTSLCTPGVVP